MNIMAKRNLFFLISGVLLTAGLVALVMGGLNLGIDFTGGTTLHIPTSTALTTGEVEEKILNDPEILALELGASTVQPFSYRPDLMQDEEYGVLFRTRFLTDAEEATILQTFTEEFGAIDTNRLQVQRVGPVIGRELLRGSMMALLLASVLMVAYITLRFNSFPSGIAAIAALLHDVFIVLGLFAILGREINGPFVAAVLTIVGYSINDTIVLFDRVRENIQNRKKGEAFESVVNRSILQTLRRSVNTSLTTILAIGALYLFGGPSIKDFTLALIVGLLAGTYSSICIAAPVWVSWQERVESVSRGGAAKVKA